MDGAEDFLKGFAKKKSMARFLCVCVTFDRRKRRRIIMEDISDCITDEGAHPMRRSVPVYNLLWLTTHAVEKNL